MGRTFDAAAVAAMLPKEPPPGFLKDAGERFQADLGGQLCVFSRASASEFEEFDDCGAPLAARSEPPRRWVSKCRCTACGYQWHSGYKQGGRDGWGGPGEPPRIVAVEPELGETGEIFPGIPGEGDTARTLRRGDSLRCPWCGESLTVTPAADLSGGRLHQVMLVTLARAENHTAVLYWMVSRRFGVRYGVPSAVTEAAPRAAAVLDGFGNVRLFLFRDGAWRAAPSAMDPEDVKYHSYEANSQQKAGCCFLRDFSVSPRSGDTGEKTGLWDYLQGGGTLPVKYLRFWRKNRNVENLIKAGWNNAVNTALDAEWARRLAAAPLPGENRRRTPDDEISCIADFCAARPCDMLHMTREEVRQGAAWKWDAQTLMLWCSLTADYNEVVLLRAGDAGFFHQMCSTYGLDNIREWGQPEDGLWSVVSLREADRYLRRQVRTGGMVPNAAMKLYWDYLNMLSEDPDYPDGITREEFYPNRLRFAHDNLVEKVKLKKKHDFQKINRAWAGLEWTDGRLCIRLPRSNEDLLEEGRTLHHCVGSYGASHVKGKMILFVRHYRRPERPWLTLQEDVSGPEPRRMQFRGYRNGHVNGKRLRIPPEAAAFVDRWEREVLRPLFREKLRSGEAGQFKRRRMMEGG